MRLQQIVLMTSVAALAACGDNIGPAPTPTLEISVVTSGLDPDPDGYLVTIDGTPYAPLPPGETLTVTSLAVGNHVVELGGMAANCGASEAALTVTLEAGATSFAAFQVTCTATTAVVAVTTSTAGPDPDADGYEVDVDGTVVRTVTANGTVYIERVASGTHLLRLQGFAMNCAPVGDDTASVTLSTGGLVRDTAHVSFSVQCTRPITRITVQTTGTDIDASGYVLFVDCPTAAGYWGYCVEWDVLPNDLILSNRVSGGQHSVGLRGVASNCAVSGENPRSVSFAGDTVNVAFGVECRSPASGRLRVTTRTTGTDIDGDGFTASIPNSAVTSGFAVPVNGEATSGALPEGPLAVTLSGVSINCTASPLGPVTVTITDDTTADVTFDVSCTPAPEIAASMTANGNREIYLLKLNDSAPQRLTFTAESETHPAWSPDGTRIAFTSDRDGKNEIYTMNPDGSGQKKVTSLPGVETADNAAWSPDGTRIAFAMKGGGVTRVYVVNADGSELRWTGWDGRSPSWSPDGQRIVFWKLGTSSSWDELVVAAIDGTSLDTIAYGAAPAWSPDGRRIAFLSDDYYSGFEEGARLRLVNADGTQNTDLHWDVALESPTWSPDGNWIVADRGSSLLIISPAGVNPRTIPGAFGQPSWRP